VPKPVVSSGQKRKNMALLLVLVALIVLIYAITLMRMSGA